MTNTLPSNLLVKADTSPFEMAKHLTAGGFALCVMSHGSKGPVTVGWEKLENCLTSPTNCEALRDNHLNIGLVHAHSGTCCLDIDDEQGAAEYLLSRDIALAELIASSPYAIVGKRGIKPLFRVPKGFSLTTKKVKAESGAVLFELRAAGGQDVLPPSQHPSGITYTWLNGKIPNSVKDLPPLPSEVLALWLELQTPKEAPKPYTPVSYQEDDRALKYCLAALAGEATRVASTPTGGRNEALNKAIYVLAGFIPTLGNRGADFEEVVRDEMTRAGLACGLESHEVETTIRGALKRGVLNARAIPERNLKPSNSPSLPPYEDDLSHYDDDYYHAIEDTGLSKPVVIEAPLKTMYEQTAILICQASQRAIFQLDDVLTLTEKELTDELLEEARGLSLPVYLTSPNNLLALRLDREGLENYLLKLEANTLEALGNAINEAKQSARDHDKSFLEHHFLALADKRLNRGAAVYPTGLGLFDKAIGGGFYDGLHVLGGATGGGKTALALAIAQLNARAGRPVLFVTYEQSKYELWSRLIASQTRLTLGEMRRGALNRDDIPLSEALSKSEAFKDIQTNIASHLLIAEGDGLGGALWGVERMLSHVRRIKAAYGMSPLIILDYLQRMPVTGTEKDRRLQIDDTVKAIQVQLGRGEQTPVIAISSLSRGNYGELLTEPLERRLEVFKESGGIEYSAYTASLLYRLSAHARAEFNLDPEPSGLGLSEPFRYVVLDLAKNREGDAGQQFCLKWYPKRGQFEQVGTKPLDSSILSRGGRK